MNYFNNITDLNNLKNTFRKLCVKLHPDTSGYNSQSDFIAMHKEFKALSKRLKFTTGKESDKDFNEDKFYDIVKKFDGLTDIKLSFVGSFIWLEDVNTGAMYQQKDAIKSIKIDGYNSARWASKKKSWYFSPQDYKQLSKSKKTLSEIKSTFGSQSFTTKKAAYLNA
jgi:hypothetical protein